METLPNEILMKVFDHLPFRDCLSLGSTSTRFHHLVPAAVGPRIERLIIRGEDSTRMAWIEECNLFSNIVELRVNVDSLNKRFLERLKSFCASCPNIRILHLDSVLPLSEVKRRMAIVKLLNRWLPSLTLKEFHSGLLDGSSWNDGLIMPPGVETCTVSYQTLKTALVGLIDDFDDEDTDEDSDDDFEVKHVRDSDPLSTIRRLHLVVDDMVTFLEPNIWTILSKMPQMEELSISGITPSLEPMRGDAPISLGVKCLRLDLPFVFDGLQNFLRRFDRVTSLFMDVSQLTWMEGRFSVGSRIQWPTSLTHLHLYGLVPDSGEEKPGSWGCFFNELEAPDSKVTITQDFQFPLDSSRSSKFFMPNVQQGYELVRQPCLTSKFKDFYFWIRTPWEWARLGEILRSVPEVNRLYLHMSGAPGVDSLNIASPVITSPIQHLTINFQFQSREASDNLIASFENVGELSLLSGTRIPEPDIPERPPFTGHVSVRLQESGFFKGCLPLEDQLREYQLISHLTINNVAYEPLDLHRLSSLVGPSLRTLEVVGSCKDKCDSNSDSCCTVDTSTVSACFSFPAVEKIRFRELCRGKVKHWLKVFASVKLFTVWPATLKEIIVHQRGDGQYLRVADFGLGPQILHFKKSSFDALGFHGSHAYQCYETRRPY